MGKPNVTVNIEPGDGISVFYLMLAPQSHDDNYHAQVSLKLLIENLDTENIHLNLIKISFVAPPFVNDKTIAVAMDIVPNGTVEWHFNNADNLILPFPTPVSLKLSLFFDGFVDPYTVDRSLTAYQTSFPPGSYAFPGKIQDLQTEEYWAGTSAVHAPAGDGSQLFGYDMDIIAFDADKNAFTYLIPGGSDSNNEDYRIWGTPVYAMADGKIVSYSNEEPTNLSPPADLSPPGRVEGNHFYIQHGDELMLYAHLQEGSLEPKFTKKDPDEVRMGDRLGLIGNSGNSTRPHLHIHAIRGNAAWSGPLQPIPFRGIQVLAVSELISDINQPWVSVNGQGLPATWTAIWPAIPIPKIPDIEKWKAIVYIIFGVTMDAGGLALSPSGKPIPIGPWDPLRHLSPAKRDILLGLAVTEIASIADDSKSKLAIEKLGIDVITNAIKKMAKAL